MHVRKNGRVTEKNAGDVDADRLVRGPYTLTYCQETLRRVLAAEQESRRLAPPGQQVELISDTELLAIRRIWRYERGDWEDSVRAIVHEVGGRQVDWVVDDSAVFSPEDERLLSELCASADVPVEMLKQLIDCERELSGLGRRSDIRKRLHQILGRDWRSEAAVLADITEREAEGTPA